MFKTRWYFNSYNPWQIWYNHYISGLRKHFLNYTKIIEIVYSWNFPQVIADTMTIIVKNCQKQKYDFEIKNDFYSSIIRVSKDEILADIGYQFRKYKNQKYKDLITKLLSNTQKISDISKNTSGFGGKSELITEERINNKQIPIFKGKSILRYGIKSNFFFEFKGDNITGRTRDVTKLSKKEKILMRKTGRPLTATYDDSSIFPEQSLYFIYDLNSDFHHYFIFSLL